MTVEITQYSSMDLSFGFEQYYPKEITYRIILPKARYRFREIYLQQIYVFSAMRDLCSWKTVRYASTVNVRVFQTYTAKHTLTLVLPTFFLFHRVPLESYVATLRFLFCP